MHERFNFLDESQEKHMIDSEKEREKGSPKVTTTREALKELVDLQTDRREYSFDDVENEKPLTHYSKIGNIFQILRFGIQGNNFKNRLNALREDNPGAEKIGEQISGLRIKQGGSYQGEDSICLSKDCENLTVRPSNVIYLINPNIKTFGNDERERDRESGYGSGIKIQVVEEDYKIGNPTAYSDEVLAANIILPKEIRAIVVDDSTSILLGLTRSVREKLDIYIQQKRRNPRAGEDLVADLKLIADLSNNENIINEARQLEEELTKMQSQEIFIRLKDLYKKAISGFVGNDKALNEDNLRNAIEEKFNIRFIKK